MKMIKILQGAVVLMFIAMVVTGILTLVYWPNKLDGYKTLVETIFPYFMSTVIPALIGKPLTEGVKNLTQKK